MTFWQYPQCEHCGERYPSVQPRPILLHADGSRGTMQLCDGCMPEMIKTLDTSLFVEANADLPMAEVFSEKERRRLEFLKTRANGGDLATNR